MSDTLFLFYPKDETKDVIVSSVDKERLSSNPNIIRSVVKKDELIEKTKGEMGESAMVSYDDDALFLRKGWEKIEADEVIEWQTWFYLWQSAVRNLTKYYSVAGQRASVLNSAVATIRFCVSIPSFFGWIGLQTLRDQSKPTVDPTLEVYTNQKKEWDDPFQKTWVESIVSVPSNPLKQLPLQLWDRDANAWKEGAALQEHQTTPLMFMNETSPMQGILLYHFLGKGKSAASIAISRMYPKRKVLVMVPASLRSNYEKEIASFGGHEYRLENEWVFVPVLVDKTPNSGRNTATNLWHPSKQFQFNLPTVKFSDATGGHVYGFWLPRTYPGVLPNVNYGEEILGSDCSKYVDVSHAIMTNRRFRIVHYNAGESTYRQLIRFGLDHSARMSLLAELLRRKGNPEGIVVKDQIHKLDASKEKIWNQFSASFITQVIVNSSFKHPEWNPFNSSLVIVDESHNFISQMMTNLGNLMYMLRMTSIDCRTVFLSGTPMMNHPIEFLFMFDFLKGPQLEYILATDVLPSRVWKPGTKHTLISKQKDGKMIRRVKVSHPMMGWVKQADGSVIMDEDATIQSLKLFYGGGDVMITNGQIETKSQYGIAIVPDVKAKMRRVDMDRTMKVFEETILNQQKNGFRTDSDQVSKMIQGAISYQGKTSDIGSLFPESVTVYEQCQMNYYQALIYLQTRIFEADREKVSKKTQSIKEEQVTLRENDRRIGEAAMNLVTESMEQGDDKKQASGMYRIFSRQVCNIAYPSYVPYDVVNKKSAVDAEPLTLMKREDFWLEDHPRHSDDAQTSLSDFSTKYAKSLQNMMKSPGLVLLYTFFRVREGIESIEAILKQHGARKVKTAGVIEPRIVDEENEIPLVATHPNPVSEDRSEIRTTVCVGDLLLKTDIGVNEPIFVTFMGRKDGSKDEIGDDTEVKIRMSNKEEREGSWGDLKLLPFQYGVVSGEDKEDRGALISLFRSKRNRKGVDAAVLMITKAGAEGLDLKSVRQVHVMEPFWNEVRVKQVIGRGSRNKSHEYLHPEENNVQNYVYTAVLSRTGDLMSKLIKEKRTSIEIARRVMNMTPEAIKEVENKTIKDILNLNEETDWSSHLLSLYGQFINDLSMTSDEFVKKTSERKQILIDQALKMYAHTSIESVRQKDDFKPQPIFLTPYAVYNDPNMPIEYYLREIRDTLLTKQTEANPTPTGRFPIPVYYAPFYVDRSPDNQWKEELMQIQAEFRLNPTGSIVMTKESPIDMMVDRFEKKYKDQRLGRTSDEHKAEYERLAKVYIRQKVSSVPMIFMKEAHKEAIMLDLIGKRSRTSMDRVGGVFSSKMRANLPFVMKVDDSLITKLSDDLESYWKQQGFKRST